MGLKDEITNAYKNILETYGEDVTFILIDEVSNDHFRPRLKEISESTVTIKCLVIFKSLVDPGTATVVGHLSDKQVALSTTEENWAKLPKMPTFALIRGKKFKLLNVEKASIGAKFRIVVYCEEV